VRESDALEPYLWLWVIIPTVFFSMSQSKLPGYILPVIPALAALIALEWSRYMDNDPLVARWMTTEVWVACGFSLVLALMIVRGCWVPYQAPVLGIVLGASLLLGAAGLLYAFYRKRTQWMFLALAGSIVMLAAIAYWRGTVLIDGYQSTRTLSRLALPYISPRAPLVFYKYFHHTATYYTHYQTTNDSIQSVPDLCRYIQEHPQTSYLVLTQEVGYPDLKREFGARLIRHQGILYLFELRPAPGQWGGRPCVRSDSNGS
jgi:4-amino-4-deoxy-L-arabinose transferase-like glycosyltransferase